MTWRQSVLIRLKQAEPGTDQTGNCLIFKIKVKVKRVNEIKVKNILKVQCVRFMDINASVSAYGGC